MSSVVTANVLRTGAVVYLTADARWSEQLADAAIAVDAEALKQLEADATAAVLHNEVTAVYAFDVRVVGGRPEPKSVREKIRADRAPTV